MYYNNGVSSMEEGEDPESGRGRARFRRRRLGSARILLGAPARWVRRRAVDTGLPVASRNRRPRLRAPRLEAGHHLLGQGGTHAPTSRGAAGRTRRVQGKTGGRQPVPLNRELSVGRRWVQRNDLIRAVTSCTTRWAERLGASRSCSRARMAGQTRQGKGGTLRAWEERTDAD